MSVSHIAKIELDIPAHFWTFAGPKRERTHSTSVYKTGDCLWLSLLGTVFEWSCATLRPKGEPVYRQSDV